MLGVFGLIMPNRQPGRMPAAFAGGWLMAKILDPLKPERLDHLAVAVGCVLVTLLSIAASVLHGLSFFAGAR